MPTSATYPYEVAPGVVARLTISLKIPDPVALAARSKGYGPQELENLLGQELQKLINILCLEEDGGLT